MDKIWTEHLGDGPLVAIAVHDGHAARREVADLFALDDAGRLREEDPHTGAWTHVAPTRIVGTRSRFEVDLNRPLEKAVYRVPEDAWGLHVWKHEPPDDLVSRSRAEYEAFFDNLRQVLTDVAARHERFVVYDLHTYNHRRGGPTAPFDSAVENPQVNIGTGTMDRSRWDGIVDRFIGDLGNYEYPGGKLDVRENVKFRGGQVARWIHENFPEQGCAIAVEFKKFFMDEWTGEADPAHVAAIRDALQSTVSGVLEELGKR